MRTSGRERSMLSGIESSFAGATSQSRAGHSLSFSWSAPGMAPVRIASAFKSFSSCARSAGMAAWVCSTIYFDCCTASSSPMPESRRDFKISYVSVCRTRLVRATSMRFCVVRSAIYWLATSEVSDTHASATLQPAASASAHAASVARRVPPNMSISHEASNPPAKTS